jgi:hypothetical protein
MCVLWDRAILSCDRSYETRALYYNKFAVDWKIKILLTAKIIHRFIMTDY